MILWGVVLNTVFILVSVVCLICFYIIMKKINNKGD